MVIRFYQTKFCSHKVLKGEFSTAGPGTWVPRTTASMGLISNIQP